jgi:predicted acetyltransferase
MRVEVTEAEDADRAAVQNLAQLYQYDFTEFDDNDVSEDGRYVHLDTARFFGQRGSRVYVARADGKLAGFALVMRKAARARDVEQVWYMSEFFVMRKYRRRGVGATLAASVFDQHDGVWEVAQMRVNLPAQAFWRKVIGRYTGNNYTELDIDDDRWDGPVQVFTAS